LDSYQANAIVPSLDNQSNNGSVTITFVRFRYKPVRFYYKITCYQYVGIAGILRLGFGPRLLYARKSAGFHLPGRLFGAIQ